MNVYGDHFDAAAHRRRGRRVARGDVYDPRCKNCPFYDTVPRAPWFPRDPIFRKRQAPLETRSKRYASRPGLPPLCFGGSGARTDGRNGAGRVEIYACRWCREPLGNIRFILWAPARQSALYSSNPPPRQWFTVTFTLAALDAIVRFRGTFIRVAGSASLSPRPRAIAFPFPSSFALRRARRCVRWIERAVRAFVYVGGEWRFRLTH